MTNSSRKELKEIVNAHILCSFYKLGSTSKDSDDLSIRFHRDMTTREREMTNKKTTGNYLLRAYFKDVFGFPELQENATHGVSM